MRYFLFVVVGILYFSSASSQIILKPTIGSFAFPQDSDHIAPIVRHPNPFFDLSGIQVGDTANEFILYTLSGQRVLLTDILKEGKPLLIMTGSYTCPVFRYNIPTINEVAEKYRKLLNIYIICNVEAHPIIDECPYIGNGDQSDVYNKEEGIQYRQPTTYGERKSIVNDMLRNLTIDANILIDGPDNEYHTHFGPAPNNAYLIGTTGIVRFKEGWLDRNGSSIHNDLDDFFKNDTVTKPRDFGTASYQFITSDTVNVQAGSQAEFDGIFTNTTHSDAIIKIQRVINDVPEGWSSAICTDVCFGTQVDSAVLRVPADSSASLKLYINVPSESGEANVQLRFTNINVPSDPVFVDFYSRALPRESVSASNTSFQMATISPNPVNEQFRINFVGTYSSIRIVDILGKTIKILP